MGIGGWIIYLFFKGRVSDQEYDLIVDKELSNSIKARAISKLGTDISEFVSEEVVITGPRLWDTANCEILYKPGEDGVLRFTPMNVTVINFTQNQLLIYSCCYDVLTGNCINENTDEYFYKDVVSVSTKTESTDSKIGYMQLNSAETFVLTTSGGTSISILLSDPQLIEKMGGGSIPKTKAEKAIQSVRVMLRDVKSS